MITRAAVAIESVNARRPRTADPRSTVPTTRGPPQRAPCPSQHVAMPALRCDPLQLPAIATSDHALLAGFRHSLRVLDQAIETGAKDAGLTLQQQAFLLSLMARGARRVALADLRADLTMDQATTSDLLARLLRRRLVSRRNGRDRRAVMVSMTPAGRVRFERSVRAISREIRRAKARGDLDALQRNLRAYLAFYSR